MNPRRFTCCLNPRVVPYHTVVAHAALCITANMAADISDGSFAPEPSGASATRCPLCPQLRPKNCSAAIRRDGPISDIGQFHSITSSQLSSRPAGTSRLSALAVLRLRTVLNRVGRSTGEELAGLAPLRILSNKCCCAPELIGSVYAIGKQAACIGKLNESRRWQLVAKS